jgi:hypothetical protein
VGSALVLYGGGAAVARVGPSEQALSGRSVAIVVCAALLGALPRVLWSLRVSIGCRDVRWRVLLGHGLSLPLAVALGAVFAFDAGFLGAQRTDPYALAALAAAGGLLADAARRALLRALGLKPKAT